MTTLKKLREREGRQRRDDDEMTRQKIKPSVSLNLSLVSRHITAVCCWLFSFFDKEKKGVVGAVVVTGHS